MLKVKSLFKKSIFDTQRPGIRTAPLSYTSDEGDYDHLLQKYINLEIIR